MQIRGENVSLERGGRLVFNNLNFSAASGELLQLQGPNGSGKSSLLRLVANLGEATTGRVTIDGGDPDVSLAEQAHYVSHADAAKSALTVSENLEFWSRFLHGGNPAAALRVWHLEDLAGYPAALLSAGQKRRLALARLALVPRKIWLLDEPSVGLDVASQGLLVELLKSHLSSGGIILAATHVSLGLPPHAILNLGVLA